MGDLAPLAAELGAAPPAAFGELDDEALARFAELIRRAKDRRAAEILGAIDASLAMVPRLLRPPVRKVLGV